MTEAPTEILLQLPANTVLRIETPWGHIEVTSYGGGDDAQDGEDVGLRVHPYANGVSLGFTTWDASPRTVAIAEAIRADARRDWDDSDDVSFLDDAPVLVPDDADSDSGVPGAGTGVWVTGDFWIFFDEAWMEPPPPRLRSILDPTPVTD